MSIYNLECIYSYNSNELDNFLGINYPTLSEKRYHTILLLIERNLVVESQQKLILKYPKQQISEWLREYNTATEFQNKLYFPIRQLLKEKYLQLTYTHLHLKLSSDFLDTISLDKDFSDLIYDEIMDNIPYKINYNNILDSLNNYRSLAIKLVYNDYKLNVKSLSPILRDSVENWCDIAIKDISKESLVNLVNRNNIFFRYMFSDLVKNITQILMISVKV